MSCICHEYLAYDLQASSRQNKKRREPDEGDGDLSTASEGEGRSEPSRPLRRQPPRNARRRMSFDGLEREDRDVNLPGLSVGSTGRVSRQHSGIAYSLHEGLDTDAFESGADSLEDGRNYDSDEADIAV